MGSSVLAVPECRRLCGLFEEKHAHARVVIGAFPEAGLVVAAVDAAVAADAPPPFAALVVDKVPLLCSSMPPASGREPPRRRMPATGCSTPPRTRPPPTSGGRCRCAPWPRRIRISCCRRSATLRLPRRLCAVPARRSGRPSPRRPLLSPPRRAATTPRCRVRTIRSGLGCHCSSKNRRR